MRGAGRRAGVCALSALALFASSDAQPAPRRATNVAALVSHPDFYHLRPVVIVGRIESKANGDLEISDGTATLHVVSKVSTPDGLDEIRGDFWDLGRLKQDDPRLAGIDLRATFHIDPQTAAWPRPGDVTAIIAATVAPASYPLSASIRAIVLSPTRFLGQRVTITGQYGGRNLDGDLPDAPGRSRFDFVLRAIDAAIWVTNIQPRGKDFTLGLDAHIDTGRWLQVSGTVQQGRGLQWIDADAGSLVLAKAPVDTAAQADPIRVAPAPPPEVIFSTPTDDETDVAPKSSVRIQFSREINAASLKGHIRVAYVDALSHGEIASAPMPELTTQYTPAARVLEIKFVKPLEPFRTVKVMLLEGIIGRDEQPVKPWSLTFAVGAQ
jgi:hypothetical protein